MNDMKLVLWRLPYAQVPARVGDVAMLDIDFASHPDLLGHLNDGWEVVNHTVQPVDSDVLLTLFMVRAVVPPDDASEFE